MQSRDGRTLNQTTERYATVAGVRADIEWLHNAWMNIRDDAAYTAMNSDPLIAERLDMFHERLHTTAGSDVALRATQGYSGCVFKPKSCPSSGPVICGGCVQS